MELEHGNVVRCTVDRISGTTVFVNIDGESRPGTIVLSEVAPGRIRNLRDYVVPKKTIVCKILRISNDHIELSLRRVTPKEQKEVLAQYKLEKSCESVIKTVLHEKSPEIIKKIKEKDNLYYFLEEAKKEPSKLEDFVSKEECEKILTILNTQKTKKSFLEKEITLKSIEPDGLNKIKKILNLGKEIKINYIGSGKYSLKTEEKDIKKADNKLTEAIEKIEKEAKTNNIDFFQK